MTIGWHFNNTYSKLSDTFREEIKPIPVNNPELVILNKNLASELESWLIDFQEKPYDVLVDNAEADIFEYKRLVEELGVPMDDEVKYLEDTIIGKYWYGNHERTFNEEPNYSYLVNQVNKLD